MNNFKILLESFSMAGLSYAELGQGKSEHDIKWLWRDEKLHVAEPYETHFAKWDKHETEWKGRFDHNHKVNIIIPPGKLFTDGVTGKRIHMPAKLKVALRQRFPDSHFQGYADIKVV